MDADYDPKRARENLLEELKRDIGKKRRNRKRKSKLAGLLAEVKPKFIPEMERSYAEYMEEYYQMDCEDVIGGDLPTRFKYREVVPNDYGLSIEEILLADDKELTQWVPLKKIVKHRPPNAEKSELKTYAAKAADVELKRRVLPSLFKDLPQEPELVVPVKEGRKKKKKKKKTKANNDTTDTQDTVEVRETGNENNVTSKAEEMTSAEDERGDNKVKLDDQNESGNPIENAQESIDYKDISNHEANRKKKKKKVKVNNEVVNENYNNIVRDTTTNDITEENDAFTFNVVTKTRKGKISKNFNKEINEQVHTDINKKAVKENEKKKHKNNNFTIENVIAGQKPNTSSDTATKVPEDKLNKEKLKRKLDTPTQELDAIPKKKSKNKKNKKSMNKNKSKLKADVKSDNPLSKLSDERLKAYGLNPKKYRGFLKYKKF